MHEISICGFDQKAINNEILE